MDVHWRAMWGMRGFAALALACFVRPGGTVHACDSEQGTACPSEAGAALGACLKDPAKHENQIEISEGCRAFMSLNDACAEEIKNSCSGMAYSDDTIVCLTQWTAASDLSEKCREALPKKEEEKDTAVDKEKEAWRNKRKAARQAAADMLEKEKEKPKKRKSRKSKKKKEL